MHEFVLEVISLNKSYNKGIVVLNDVNLHLHKGCILGLLGPNGAGKSTLINILANIVKKDSGEVYILGKKIETHSYYYKSRCGFVLERPVYINKFTINEYLRFATILYGLNDSIINNRIEELVTFFELQEKKNEWIERCSKGIKKRVSIATALLHNPKLLILDEPLADLDVIMSKKLRYFFKRLRTKNNSIVIASHNIDDLESICDEICIFKAGNIIYRHNCQHIINPRDFSNTYKACQNLETLFFDLYKGRLP